MNDNGSAYVPAAACRLLGLRHIRIRPYRPRTKGKAERFILTMLNESQYAAVYRDSAQRSSALQAWVERYNEAKTRREPGRQAPITRLRQSLNNVLGAHN